MGEVPAKRWALTIGAVAVALALSVALACGAVVAAHPEAYGITVPDPAIDYRRVANDSVWLERHAKALTCDVDDIEAWQGGDIVLYEGHIGIVSDRRNAMGVPYLIHHAGPFQLAYEEDVLATYGPILGHFRLG